MGSPISKSGIFYVTLNDAEGKPVEDGVNKIAEGLSIVEKRSDSRWGIISWFDKVAAYMRTIEIIAPPTIVNSTYEIKDENRYTYRFELVNKNLYDKIVRKLIPGSPDLPSDERVQDYLSKLNPFE